MSQRFRHRLKSGTESVKWWILMWRDHSDSVKWRLDWSRWQEVTQPSSTCLHVPVKHLRTESDPSRSSDTELQNPVLDSDSGPGPWLRSWTLDSGLCVQSSLINLLWFILCCFSARDKKFSFHLRYVIVLFAEQFSSSHGGFRVRSGLQLWAHKHLLLGSCREAAGGSELSPDHSFIIMNHDEVTCSCQSHSDRLYSLVRVCVQLRSMTAEIIRHHITPLWVPQGRPADPSGSRVDCSGRSTVEVHHSRSTDY